MVCLSSSTHFTILQNSYHTIGFSCRFDWWEQFLLPDVGRVIWGTGNSGRGSLVINAARSLQNGRLRMLLKVAVASRCRTSLPADSVYMVLFIINCKTQYIGKRKCSTDAVYANFGGHKHSLVSLILQAKERKDVRLYYGARSPEHMAFKEDIPEWEKSGVKVIPVYSNDGEGFVQDIFLKVCTYELSDRIEQNYRNDIRYYYYAKDRLLALHIFLGVNLSWKWVL